MSALNMAMNGNAYKMIEIKKVSGPVVPLSSLNPLSTLTDRYEPLPSGPSGPSQQQRTFTDLNSLNHNPAYNLGPGSIQEHGGHQRGGPGHPAGARLQHQGGREVVVGLLSGVLLLSSINIKIIQADRHGCSASTHYWCF